MKNKGVITEKKGVVFKIKVLYLKTKVSRYIDFIWCFLYAAEGFHGCPLDWLSDLLVRPFWFKLRRRHVPPYTPQNTLQNTHVAEHIAKHTAKHTQLSTFRITQAHLAEHTQNTQAHLEEHIENTQKAAEQSAEGMRCRAHTCACIAKQYPAAFFIRWSQSPFVAGHGQKQ